MSKLVLEQVTKTFGEFYAAREISFCAEEGEFVTLLGPSGCGKTTLLKMIGGFHQPDSGRILIGDKTVNALPPEKRNTAMCFQSYALFPHLNVAHNICFGLKQKKATIGEQQARLAEALKQVGLESQRLKMPGQLSGGQQQRVALARAMITRPDVILFDEPLSNLDAKLRVQMRSIIKKLQRRLGITTIYVTHDQEEALAISDRIAVMKEGRIMQIGTPREIYAKPAHPFVAGFIGVSNFIKCTVKGKAGRVHIAIDGMGGEDVHMDVRCDYQGEGTVSARPEQLFFAKEGLPGQVLFSTFLGDYIEYEVQLAGGQTVLINEYTKDTNEVHQVGEDVHIHFDPSRVSLYDRDGEVLSR